MNGQGYGGYSAKLALIALSVVAACSLARCFFGPGEIVPAVVAGVVANVSVLLATGLGARRRWLGVLCGVVGALVAFACPIWITAGSATTFGWPTFSTFHLIGRDLNQAWDLFNRLRSPIFETAGFTMIGAWAVVIAALLSGWAAVDGDTSVWVVAPPAAIFLFTSALGTAAWRGEAIGAEVCALAWYLVASRSARLARDPALAPVVRHGAAHSHSHARSRFRRPAVALPAVLMIAVAALVAATIGPRLPGAVSSPLVSLRYAPGQNANGGLAQPPAIGQVAVSTLVQVAEQEIYQPATTFFTVSTSQPGYMVLTTLDTFDGNSWSTTSPSDYSPLPSPPPTTKVTRPLVPGTYTVQSTIQVGTLGGSLVPAPPTPAAASGSVGLNYDSTSETIQATAPLQPTYHFQIDSYVPKLSAAKLAPSKLQVPASVQADLQRPADIPQSLIDIAHYIVKYDTTPYQKARALEFFFQDGNYTYSLPRASSASAPVATGGEGLADLVKFLFSTRTGFCQQYSSAYALLARIDGLPTRIAVGFQPGTRVRHKGNEYDVTGIDVHAWPQVWLGGAAGWVNFEPTPGSAYTVPTAPGTRPHPHPPTGGTGTGPNGGRGPLPRGHAHQFQPPPPTGTGARVVVPVQRSSQSVAPGTSLAAFGWLFGILGLLLVILGAAPAERALRRRRARSPSARVLVAWRSAVNSLGLVGLVHNRGESYNDLARRVARGGVLTVDVGHDLAVLAGVSTVAAFSSRPPPPGSVEEALAASRRVGRAARRRAGLRRTFWSLVTPRGLLEREGY